MSKLRSVRRAVKRAWKVAAAPALSPVEIIDITHPAVNEKMVQQLLPDGIRVPISDLQQVTYLVTHPMELDQTPPAMTKAIGAKFNGLLNEQFRGAQERLLEETGKARP
jgi:hypothetical protein